MSASVSDEIIDSRAELIRKLSQGPGLTKQAVVDLGDSISVFGSDNPEEVYNLIQTAAYTLTGDSFGLAIKNALGVGRKGNTATTLTERRMEFIAEFPRIKYRQLVRHEQDGAERLAKHIEVARELSGKVGGEIFDTELTLEQRVRDLEAALTFTTEFMVNVMYGELGGLLEHIGRKVPEPSKFTKTYMSRFDDTLDQIYDRVAVDVGWVDDDGNVLEEDGSPR